MLNPQKLRIVHNFGTENRVTDPSKIVAASDIVQDFLTFQSTDISDLFVHESPAAEAPKEVVPAAPAAKVQPIAKVSQNQAPRHNNSRQGQQGQGQGQGHGRPRNQNHDQQGDNQNRSARREPQAQSGHAAGTGDYLLKLREKKNAEGGNTESPAVSTEAFDFSANNDKFKKGEVLATIAAENSVDTDSKYKKDDFFDSLSNDAVNRAQEGAQPRRSQAEERNLNQDTFGAIALQSNSYRRGGYRGGGRGGGRGGEGEGGSGRGGRGRGRGGGRGRGRGQVPSI
jgi:hypothetical protein